MKPEGAPSDRRRPISASDCWRAHPDGLRPNKFAYLPLVDTTNERETKGAKVALRRAGRALTSSACAQIDFGPSARVCVCVCVCVSVCLFAVAAAAAACRTLPNQCFWAGRPLARLGGGALRELWCAIILRLSCEPQAGAPRPRRTFGADLWNFRSLGRLAQPTGRATANRARPGAHA